MWYWKLGCGWWVVSGGWWVVDYICVGSGLSGALSLILVGHGRLRCERNMVRWSLYLRVWLGTTDPLFVTVAASCSLALDNASWPKPGLCS